MDHDVDDMRCVTAESKPVMMTARTRLTDMMTARTMAAVPMTLKQTSRGIKGSSDSVAFD